LIPKCPPEGGRYKKRANIEFSRALLQSAPQSMDSETQGVAPGKHAPALAAASAGTRRFNCRSFSSGLKSRPSRQSAAPKTSGEFAYREIVIRDVLLMLIVVA
jgi:hypothetical protein